MASRGGARAKGTDGGDFGHRETVASHYQISSSNKRRLKTAIFFHVLLTIYVLAKLSPKILEFLDISTKIITIQFPHAHLWEIVWLTSIGFLIAAYLGLRKNQIFPMKVYAFGTFICGIFPLIFAIVYHSGDLNTFISDRLNPNVEKFYGIPVILISCVFVTIAFLVHSLSIMFAVNLTRAWAPKRGKKKA